MTVQAALVGTDDSTSRAETDAGGGAGTGRLRRSAARRQQQAYVSY
ncbi:hypothetical protein [Mycobacterium sp.]